MWSTALKLLGVIAQGFGVTLLVETNGVYSDTKRLRTLLDKVNLPSVAALWDMHHPYRYAWGIPRRRRVQNLGGLHQVCPRQGQRAWWTAGSSTA